MIKCIECGKDCPEPFVFQSSDIFSQSWIRVCDLKCFYGLISEFLYSVNEHKSFYSWVDKKENATDKEMRWKETDEITKRSMEELGKSFKKNKNLLTQPSPCFKESFLKGPINLSSTVRFKRYRVSLEDKIKGTEEKIHELEEELKASKDELKELKKEIT